MFTVLLGTTNSVSFFDPYDFSFDGLYLTGIKRQNVLGRDVHGPDFGSGRVSERVHRIKNHGFFMS